MIFISASFFILAYGTIKATIEFHNKLLKNLIAAPQHFFDVTPIGRILTRFSSDIHVIDHNLPMTLRPSMNIFFRVGDQNKNTFS